MWGVDITDMWIRPSGLGCLPHSPQMEHGWWVLPIWLCRSDLRMLMGHSLTLWQKPRFVMQICPSEDCGHWSDPERRERECQQRYMFLLSTLG